mgnify:CR=1 FL=1
MKVEIFRRTVKDRRRGNSYELLYHLAEGIKAAGDDPVIVNEKRTGPTVEGEMEPTAPMAAMFGYGGDKQMHHTKGRRRELKKKYIFGEFYHTSTLFSSSSFNLFKSVSISIAVGRFD